HGAENELLLPVHAYILPDGCVLHVTSSAPRPSASRAGSVTRLDGMAPLRIALAQDDARVGDLEGNARKILELSRQAAPAGAELVVFGEMTVTGYPIEDLALRASFQRAAAARGEELARELATEGLGELTVVIGTLGTVAEPHPGSTAPRPSNRALVLQHGMVTAHYDKFHLPNYGVFDEFRNFAPGTSPTVFELRGRRVGIVICEDIWAEGGPVSQLGKLEVSLVVVLNGSPFEEGKGHVRTELAARRAREVLAPPACAHLVGRPGGLVLRGRSFVGRAYRPPRSRGARPPRLRQPRRRPGRPRLRRRLLRGRGGRAPARARPRLHRAPARVGPRGRRRRARDGRAGSRALRGRGRVPRARHGARGIRAEERLPLGGAGALGRQRLGPRGRRRRARDGRAGARALRGRGRVPRARHGARGIRAEERLPLAGAGPLGRHRLRPRCRDRRGRRGRAERRRRRDALAPLLR